MLGAQTTNQEHAEGEERRPARHHRTPAPAKRSKKPEPGSTPRSAIRIG